MLATSSLIFFLTLAAGLLRPGGGAISVGASEIDGRELIGEAACRAGSFDHRGYFQNPVRSQGAQGQCFAFAAANLLEEHFCASDVRGCNTRISPIDIARDYPDRTSLKSEPPLDGDSFDMDRDYFNIQNSNQGGREYRLLDAALRFGVCEERNAPYFPALESKCLGLEDRSSCVLQGLKSTWRKYQRLSKNIADPGAECLETRDGAPISKAQNGRIESVLEAAHAYLEPQVASGLDLLWALNESGSEYDFIERVLIPPMCREGRLRAPAGRVWYQSWSGSGVGKLRWNEQLQDFQDADLTNIQRFFNLTTKAKVTGRSIELGLCSKTARVASRVRNDSTSDPSRCAPHALIVNGVQWNSEKKRCEASILNSWGEDNPLQGWLPIEPVLNSTFRISGIEP